jgi:purine nucleosidase
MNARRRRKIILDTDPAVGIPGTDADDPLALMLAIKHPELDLLGVTTVFGNCPPTLGARSAAAVLHAAGRKDIPIAVGMGTSMSGGLPQALIEAYAGQRGHPGRISLPELPDQTGRPHAVDLIIELVRASPGEVSIVAIGPQTNLALALLKEPRLRARSPRLSSWVVRSAWIQNSGAETSPLSQSATSGLTRRPPILSSNPASISRW